MLDNLDQSIIKNLNRSRILRAFREKEIIQKKELVDSLNLSITTVTTNTRRLLEEGLIEETGIAESTGGRKPVVFKFIKSAKVSFGVDLSPHQATIIMTNLASEIIDRSKFSIDKQSMEEVLLNIQTIVETLLDKHGYLKADCLGIGLSLPGIVDCENIMLVNAPNLKVKNYSFRYFEATIGLKVYIENEANVAAFAELIIGAAEKLDDAVYISITDGVGCGIIANHKVTKGTFNKAGEFGHMRISDKEIICSCGRTGCWEIFSSERALLKFYTEQSGDIVTDLEAFFKIYHEGNLLAKVALRKYLDYLLIGIENIMLGLDPEVIILGGEIVNFLREIEPIVEDYMKKNHSDILSRDNKLVLSTISPYSAVVGSSLLPMKEMFGY
ncbi:ROK family transcriptional regulator [Fusibacter bizertensis]|uniref:ROK family transcriptional regulator n=1 Tax=Fusibacter bizertensis TaxID=1488331 RepID=A0ABT6N8S9_9FIRM|nr:ROK family transcriptional regulator [Fusibacter bizertensis]MDH8676813.1 ROK family transcriptional regulator [Fusibacter bizertensis]